MADIADQVEEILTNLSSDDRAVKSFAYSNLIHFHQLSTTEAFDIRVLTERSHRLLTRILSDISDDDEEIAVGALKCLGFIIYHPCLVASIQDDIASSVVESLARLVMKTKMKAVCNLGVWCISIQQFSASFLDCHFHSLLWAIIHAIDNPIGSLSTTFEAIQALIKLATQVGEKMRDSANLWAPPIYRRLMSSDKRERDMSERFLLKIRSIVIPPPPNLSKALVMDIKQKLLPRMKEMLPDHGLRVHMISAWGWLIRLLGSHALKNRHLVNEMLKIPEKTFSDLDPQIQIATLVAWEGLIDALIHLPTEGQGLTTTEEHHIQQVGVVSSDISKGHTNGNQEDRFSKSMKLIMTPLVGIISSKCDVSVLSSCLSTWCYFLHRLDLSVNSSSVLKTVLEPILEVVFQKGPHGIGIWFWNSCLDLLDEYISAKCREADSDVKKKHSFQSPSIANLLDCPSADACLWMKYPIKWLPWDLNMLNFHLKMIHVVIREASGTTVTCDNVSLAYHATLKIFRSVLKGVQIELKRSSITYNEIMLGIGEIVSFTKEVCEELISKDVGFNDWLNICLELVEAVEEEVEPSVLGSPLYRVALDLKYINELQLINDIKYANLEGIRSIAYMDMVSPMVYLTILHLCLVDQSVLNASNVEMILNKVQKQLNFIWSSYDPLENLHAIVSFLYRHRGYIWLKLWILIAKDLKRRIDNVKGDSVLKVESSCNAYVTISWFLSSPFDLCSPPLKMLTPVKSNFSSKSCQIPSSRELVHVIEVWKLLYSSMNCSLQSEYSIMNGMEDLCAMLSRVFDRHTSIHEGGLHIYSEGQDQYLTFPLFGEATICVLKQMLRSDKVDSRSSGNNGQEDRHYDRNSCIKTCFKFISSFLRLSWTIAETNSLAYLSDTGRVFSELVSFVCHLHLKQEILLVIEGMSDTLVKWLSSEKASEAPIIAEISRFWTETLNCLQRTQPPIAFDSSFLEIHATLLMATLDHPKPSISEPTIVFWNSTYGNQVKLDYPQSLRPVLDKLSRRGKIDLYKKSPLLLNNCPRAGKAVGVQQRYRVAITQKTSSKRVEFMEHTGNGSNPCDYPSWSLKKKKLELTEHQKEVRRAQQGRERDCNGHGPGVRTYTNADFSQGNEDSQESQELRNPESILEMLRRAR
ncbi:hypothetical protein NE237_028670 [Protea cynaroides]|uniref:Telomere-associated protein Rif1 N-terminal domain-containing protein n=1 Tax=Protea cynaroides TaxID=273540 RepID=A0A9Q0GQE0_9MAGN|nr:hypothetical protein NE237_028670 [Protea cynaroides]